MTLRGLGSKHTLTNCCLDKQINRDQKGTTQGLEDTTGEGAKLFFGKYVSEIIIDTWVHYLKSVDSR